MATGVPETLDPSPEFLELLRLHLVKFKSDCEMSNFWPGFPLAGKWDTDSMRVDPRYHLIERHHSYSIKIHVTNLMAIAWQIDQMRQVSPDGRTYIKLGRPWRDFWSHWIFKIAGELIVRINQQARMWGLDDLNLDWWNHDPENNTVKKDRTDWYYDILETWWTAIATPTVVLQEVALCVDVSIKALAEILTGNNRPMPFRGHPMNHVLDGEALSDPMRPGRKNDPDRPTMIALMAELLKEKKNWDEITKTICDRFGKELTKGTLRGYYYNRDRSDKNNGSGGRKDTKSDSGGEEHNEAA